MRYCTHTLIFPEKKNSFGNSCKMWKQLFFETFLIVSVANVLSTLSFILQESSSLSTVRVIQRLSQVEQIAVAPIYLQILCASFLTIVGENRMNIKLSQKMAFRFTVSQKRGYVYVWKCKLIRPFDSVTPASRWSLFLYKSRHILYLVLQKYTTLTKAFLRILIYLMQQHLSIS